MGCLQTGVGKNFQFLSAHEIAQALGPDRCVALSMFHAVIGCDMVSFFGGKGKKTAWDTWKAYQAVTLAFCALVTRLACQTTEELLGPLEQFVVLLYDCANSLDL